jgi:hypothetical protein
VPNPTPQPQSLIFALNSSVQCGMKNPVRAGVSDMQAMFIAVTIIAAIMPSLVPTADAHVTGLAGSVGPSSGTNLVYAGALAAWAMVGRSVLRG